MKYPMDTLRSHVIDDQQKWDSTLSLHKSDYLKYNILNAQVLIANCAHVDSSINYYNKLQEQQPLVKQVHL